MLKNILTLAIWVITFLCIGFVIGSSSQADIDTWYTTLNKSTLNPAPIVFPIAWSILYTLIAISGWLLWKRQASFQLKLLFMLQMLMNWLWTPLFFQAHLIGLALLWISILALVTVLFIKMAWVKHRIPATLFLPYSAWLLFAVYLNLMIWRLN